VLKNVATLPNFGTADFDVSPNGTLVYANGGDLTEKDMVRWVDRKGNIQPIPAAEKNYFLIDISPDNRRLLLSVGGANNVLWAYDLERNQPTRLTFRLDPEFAAWSHDGKHVTYWSGTDVRSIAADGSGTEEVLIPASEAGARMLAPENWSADGQKLAVTITEPGKSDDVAVYSRRDKRLVPLADTRFDEFAGGLSPDGRWLAYVSDEAGREEVFVRATEGSGVKHQVSNAGGFFVRWTQQGRELLYGSGTGLMSASFTPGQPPRIGLPSLLIDGKSFDAAFALSPAADGQWFAVLFRKPSPPITEIRVVLNWAQDLARLSR